jgi:cellobiose phosphorylase
MYRVGLEGILGLKKRGDTLYIESRAPTSWPEYRIEYRHGKSVYSIVVRKDSDGGVTVDGKLSPDGAIELVDDGKRHEVVVRR